MGKPNLTPRPQATVTATVTELLGPPAPPATPAAPALTVVAPPAMSAGQKAAWTRKQRAAGIEPAKAAKTGRAKAAPVAIEPRPEGLELVMSIAGRNRLEVRFAFRMAEGFTHQWRGPGEHEAGLEEVGLLASPDGASVHGFRSSRFLGGYASADTIERTLPVMRRVDAIMDAARIESEDESFAQAILAICTGLGVTRIEWDNPAGDRVTVRRGAAYITAHKAEAAFLAEQADTASQAA